MRFKDFDRKFEGTPGGFGEHEITVSAWDGIGNPV